MLHCRQPCLQVDGGAAVGALHARKGAHDVEDLGCQPSGKLYQAHGRPSGPWRGGAIARPKGCAAGRASNL